MVEIIDVNEWKRAASFKFYHSTTSYTVIQDCTNIYKVSQRECIPFQVVLYHALADMINRFEQFRVRIISNDYVAQYERIDFSTVELDKNKQIVLMKTKYNPCLRTFYEAYKEGRKQIKHGTLNNENTASINTVTCSALTSLRFAYAPAMDVDNRGNRGVVNFVTGKLEIDSRGVATVPIAGRFAHSLLDGYDWQLALKYFSEEYGCE